MDDVNIGHFTTEYAYDALGRRIEKRHADGTATRFVYDGSRVAEEWEISSSGGASLSASYVYGNYIDEVLTMRRGTSDYYYHGDDQHNVVKLTDNTGTVVEAYDYGDYGQPEFYSPPANPGQATGALLEVSESPFGNPYLFTGRRWDPESGYYYFRNRFMDPALGRFVSRDPIGLWGDAANLGNGYTYAASNPWSVVDPFGLCGGNQSWAAWLDGLQLGLGSAGLLPGVGIVPDMLSFAISVVRLDFTGALIDGGSAIPGAGQFVRGGDFVAKAGRTALKNGDEISDSIRIGDDVVENVTNATTHADEVPVIAKAPTESVGTGRTYEAGDILPSGRSAGTGPGTPRSGQGPDVPDVIHVTPQGVALLPDAKYSIPESYVDNPYRPGSYGEVVDGKFAERLRIDPATPTGKSGPEYSHYHLNGGREHFSPKRSDSDPGFR